MSAGGAILDTEGQPVPPERLALVKRLRRLEPARIYVDGKFHSEAAFKKLAA